MYRGFNLITEGTLNLSDNQRFNYVDSKKNLILDYYDKGINLYNQKRSNLFQSYRFFLNQDGVINGNELMQNWFHTFEKDVFISHSHKDEELAIALSGWLYDKFQINAFVDSCLWGNFIDLLKEIDDDYSIQRNPDNSKIPNKYYYEYCRYSASHINIILINALNKMIDECECLIFLNTPESIKSIHSVDYTSSPWIYTELEISRTIRKKKNRQNVSESQTKGLSEFSALQFEYQTKLDHLEILTTDDLIEWEIQANVSYQHKLDILYDKIKPINI